MNAVVDGGANNQVADSKGGFELTGKPADAVVS